MCGIIGEINLKSKIVESEFVLMRDTLTHRGPDDAGVEFLNNHTIALGHRRLSFLDLSPLGKQPFSNPKNNIFITYNGEIYNYLEIKEELKSSYNFQTETDTEVILAAYQVWGVECLERFKGMFAIAILDLKTDKLFLIRDRFGIKPLYYYHDENQLIFASELKAIIAKKDFKKEIDFTAFTDFFVYRYIPSPKTIWKNIKKLPPANYLEFNINDLENNQKTYWDLKAEEHIADENVLINEIGKLLQNSTKEHTRADVPIGSFLSGGYDSSALVYFMKENNYQAPTFSIGFDNWEKSEHHFAKIVAEHLNVENTATIATENSLELINIMPDVYDEPIADISIVPTYMVSELARKSVKAVLSGEGADEIFGGYTWQKEYYEIMNPENFSDKLKIALKKPDTVDFYANAMAMGWFDGEELKKMLKPHLHPYINTDVHWFYRQNFDKKLSPLKSIQKMDMKCFMGELVLTKIDRASMANSLEVRVPFLDHEIFQKVFNFKEKNYFKKNKTKYLLYENLKAHFPKNILDRKKQGFVGPDEYYMNMEWYKKQLEKSQLVKQNIINQDYIDSLLKENYNWKLWKILVMEKWFAKWMV
jgi:asparagine synthase (glutamine-hydrolysing)